MRPSCVLAAGGLVCALFTPAAAQHPPDTTRSAQDSALRVFFDCPSFFASGCDFDFLRTEITFVDWVRQREDAHIHLLVSTQNTGGGGTEYTLTFIGQKQFTGKADTLLYYSTGTQTSDEVRRGFAHALKLGLVRFLAATRAAPFLKVTYEPPSQQPTPVTHDPWDYWVFNTNVSGFYQAEQSQNFLSLYVSVSATRTTAAWRHNFSLGGSYNESNFHYRQDSVTAFTYRNLRREYFGDGLLVKSVTNHWSLGWRVGLSHSTRLNKNFQGRIAPAVEFDIYPYSQSTRRLLTLQYEIGAVRVAYIDSTVFDKTSQTLFDQTLTVALNATQPWGTANFSVEGATYLHDLSKGHLTVFGSTNIRLIKGLSFRIGGSASALRDQLYLSKKGLTSTDVLLQRRQLATNFQYFASFGLSYQFGSTLNNIVNPRFGGSGGGIIIF